VGCQTGGVAVLSMLFSPDLYCIQKDAWNRKILMTL